MLFLRGYNKTHPTKFRNYSLPKIYRHRKKKKTSSLQQQWLAKASSLFCRIEHHNNFKCNKMNAHV